MPYKLVRRGKIWVKINKETGRVVSHHKTKAKALASVRAYYANQRKK